MLFDTIDADEGFLIVGHLRSYWDGLSMENHLARAREAIPLGL